MTGFLLAAFVAGILGTILGQQLAVLPSMSRIFRWNKADLRKVGYTVSSCYLLVRIGFVGGAEMASRGADALLVTGVLGIALSVFICLLTFILLSRFTSFDRETRASWSAHQGSVSMGTFAAALAFLAEQGFGVNPLSTAWLVLMEVPAILVAIQFLNHKGSLKQMLREPSILLLTGALALGYCAGPHVLDAFELILEGWPFTLILCYFLFEMGRRTGQYIPELGKYGKALVMFGIGMPLLSGVFGVVAGTLAGLPLGDVAILGILCASASYVAAPAVMENAVKNKTAVATSLVASLGLILPFNLLIGMRLYLWEAKEFAQWHAVGLPAAELVLVLIVGLTACMGLQAWRMRRPTPAHEVWNSVCRNLVYAWRLATALGLRKVAVVRVGSCHSFDIFRRLVVALLSAFCAVVVVMCQTRS